MQRKRRKTKNLVIVFALIIVCIYVGYSLITSNLQVRTSLDVAKTSFDVHFENLTISKKSTISTLPTLSNDKTEISFSITLNSPGDSYIINTDIYNAGTIDAAIGALTIEGIDANASNYVKAELVYTIDNKALAVDDVIKAGENEEIECRIVYEYDSEKTDSILLSEALNLNITLNIEYVKPDKTRLDNNEYSIRPFNAYNYLLSNSVLDNEKSKYVSSNNGVDFSSPSSDTNGKGIYTLSSTANDTFPINYYRGEVYNNFVIFNNYCWKMVRTTDTGGIKLILSNIPSDGHCVTSGLPGFNGEYNYDEYDNAFVGYKYGTAESSSYEATHANTNESNILYYVRNFFEEGNKNLRFYSENENYANNNYKSLFNTDLLEENTFCNDRSIASDITEIDSTPMNNLGYGNNNTVYSGYKRLTQTFNPSLTCTNNNDRFTNYYGLLTLDEAMLGGLTGNEGSTYNYLYFGNGSYFLMTPTYFKNNISYTSCIKINSTTSSAKVDSCNTGGSLTIRPVITLNNDAKFYKGDGTPYNPYVVYNSAIYQVYHQQM